MSASAEKAPTPISDPSVEEAAHKQGPWCRVCEHAIACHSINVGCMDSMSDGSLDRDRLGFCPCQVSSWTLVRDLYERTLQDAIDDAHCQRRQVWDAERGQEPMTLEQHWSATGGWLASRIRAYKRSGEPDWPDAMNTAEEADRG